MLQAEDVSISASVSLRVQTARSSSPLRIRGQTVALARALTIAFGVEEMQRSFHSTVLKYGKPDVAGLRQCDFSVLRGTSETLNDDASLVVAYYY